MIDISKWAFENKKLIYFLIAVLIVGGAYSSYEMSKLEDPEITVKLAMVVTTYPGASAHQVELEVTDVLEKNIRSMGNIDNVESYSYNDLSLIQVELKTTVKETDVEQCWDLLRRKVVNAQAELPEQSYIFLPYRQSSTWAGTSKYIAEPGSVRPYPRLLPQIQSKTRTTDSIQW